MALLALLLPAVLLYVIVYLLGKYNECYWRRRGVVLYARHKITGVYWDFVFNDRPIFEALWDIYKSYPDKSAVGVGFFLTPALYLRSPKNIRHVLATNFSQFNHRAVEANAGDVLADNVLFMFGKRWKIMRQNLTPLFTSKKLRDMYYIIDKSAQDFTLHLKSDQRLWHGDAYHTISTFCSAAIGAAVFGISPESIFESPFLNMAQKAFKPTFWSNTNLIISNVSLELSKLLGIKLFKEHEKLFVGAIKRVIEERKCSDARRHDFAELCVSLQRGGTLRDARIGCELQPTDELLAAQAFFFFIAGVEPTASALFGTLFELGKHPDHLRRLHDEIDQTFEKYNGVITADAIMEMVFLDMVVCEALRLYPPVGYLKRLCVGEAVLPDGDIRVERGTRVFAPVFELHHDPEYFPQPEQFRPERFSPENKRKVPEFTYMPFGRGSRVCIGMKYALLQVKAGLLHLLRHFTVRSRELPAGMRYSKQQLQVRLDNVDVEFLPRTSS